MNILFIFNIAIIPVLVLLNGLIAGLTLGLLSLDDTKLQVLIISGSPTQQKAALRISPLRKDTHLLLATLLLGNTIINEALPVILHNVVKNEIIAIVVSVIMVLSFSELLPQSLCAHYGLQIGSYFAWFVYVLRFIFYPIAYPLAKLLDFFLGTSHGALYKKAELREFVKLHGADHGGDLIEDEVKIVQGTLSLQGKSIDQIMTKLEYVIMLDIKTELTQNVLESILDTGHSRIPVYSGEKNNIVGIMLVKGLILLDDDTPTKIEDLAERVLIKAPIMNNNTSLFDAINYFQEGASHLAIIQNDDGNIIGICTLEDIIEDILMEEILDESDQWTDNTQTRRVNRPPRSSRKQYGFGLVAPQSKVLQQKEHKLAVLQEEPSDISDNQQVNNENNV